MKLMKDMKEQRETRFGKFASNFTQKGEKPTEPKKVPKFRDPDFSPLASASRGNRMIPFCPGKPRAFRYQQRFLANGISLATNSTSFHEWGAASPENFIVGFIRVHSRYSWLKCSATSEWTGSFAFPADQDF